MIPMSRRSALRFLGGGLAAAASGAWLADLPDPSANAQPAADQPTTAPTTAAATELLTRPIPSSNEALPVIGLGTWQTFDVGGGRDEREPLEAVLAAFVALGGKVIDSSPMYGRSETVVGDIAAKLGLLPKLFVATKVWISGQAAGVKQMQESMQKLQSKTIDLMQVHNLVDVDVQLETLRQWKRDGRVRYIGVTHYTASRHDDVIKVLEKHAVDFVQINYSVGEREAENRLLPLARERGVAVIANRPFAGGELLRGLRNQPLPTVANDIGCTSWAQLLLKWVISHPAMTCAIPATSKLAHLRDNMNAAKNPLPDETQRAKILAAIR